MASRNPPGLALALAGALCASAADAGVLCVSARKANVRDDPKGAVLWAAHRHTPFELLEWEGAWALVSDVDRDTGWIHRSVLSKGPCAISTAETANVRSGPGAEHEVLWEVERGYPFRVLRRRGAWVEVSDGEELEGWIYRTLIWGSPPAEDPDDVV